MMHIARLSVRLTVYLATIAVFLHAPTLLAEERYQSGFQRGTIEDPMGGSMQFSVWYPTELPESELSLGPFRLSVAEDAELAEGQFGLVILSHGTGGSDLGHRDVARMLARHGFIAVAVLHPRDNFRDGSGLGQRIVWEGRPRQVVSMLDHVLTNAPWANKIDPTKIGLFGFSLGGYTMLSVLGARHDPRVLAEHCVTHVTDPLCTNFGDLTGRMQQIADIEYKTPMGLLADQRARAVLLVDPMTGIFADDTIADLADVPLSIYLPELENELLARLHGGRIVRVLAEDDRTHQPSLSIAEGAHHFSFISPFPESVAKQIPNIASDFADFDRVAFHQQFSIEVAQFFVRNLP